MKIKLIKRDDDFYSLKVDGIVMATSNGMLVDYRLSLKNCDSLFGVVDVENLADDYFKSTNENSVLWRRIDFKEGFNKAMELNDKLFTVEDIRKAIEMARKGSMQEQHNGYGQRTSPIFVSDNLSVDTIIQSLQQPTEIEVEIEMDICGDKVYAVPEPKLDKNGCLMLRRI